MTSQELKIIIAENARLRAESEELRLQLKQKIEESLIARNEQNNLAKISCPAKRLDGKSRE